jgi:hypothetical protein
MKFHCFLFCFAKQAKFPKQFFCFALFRVSRNKKGSEMETLELGTKPSKELGMEPGKEPTLSPAPYPAPYVQ